MAGLLIKELKLRGELERCLIVAPGSLSEQWQDELSDKFGLEFEVFSRDMIVGDTNPFDEHDLLIVRLDQLSRSEDLQKLFKAGREWDLVVCDEAHRMSGHLQGEEIKVTQRYRLGRELGTHTRNLLLMSATPHNGRDDDFQIFLALLDPDRFAGRASSNLRASAAEVMRRLTKEDLLRFDGTKLFPDRRTYTVQYPLSDLERQLYDEVSDYVRQEMNRAERLKGAVNVAFALMTLQRRLASSPDAIYTSLSRRRARLEARLTEASQSQGGWASPAQSLTQEDWDEAQEEMPQEERERLEQEVVDQATSARNLGELQTEIKSLRKLEALAKEVCEKKLDAKWKQLSEILDDKLMRDAEGHRRKLVIFTEFRDTLAYLARRIESRLGRPEAVVQIHGGVSHPERRRVVEAFMTDPEVVVLVANDAAGEGVNLQRAHLMVNYDLPWNPNRLEQRFGRIHRIGQTEVCHLWNMVAQDTREGDVYSLLLQKLENERATLGGKVFDVLGQLFEDMPLRQLLMDAVRSPSKKAEVVSAVDSVASTEKLKQAIERQAILKNQLPLDDVQSLRHAMDLAQIQRPHPFSVKEFFLQAFKALGGLAKPREQGRFEVSHVPASIIQLNQLTRPRAPLARTIPRLCFERAHLDGPPQAKLLAPGDPLLDATIAATLQQFGDSLLDGAIFVDETTTQEEPRMLFLVEHAICDGRQRKDGTPVVVSQRSYFLEFEPGRGFLRVGKTPHFNLRPVRPNEKASAASIALQPWLQRDWETQALNFVAHTLVAEHFSEVQSYRLPRIERSEKDVRARVMKEINRLDQQAAEAKAAARAGKPVVTSAKESTQADELQLRLRASLELHKQERTLTPMPPRLRALALVIPEALLQTRPEDFFVSQAARDEVERLAMVAVLEAERALGRIPRDVSQTTGPGYDIESQDPRTNETFFIEVKGRHAEAETVTLTRNEIRCSQNMPDRFRLAVVLVEAGKAHPPRYVKGFNFGQPGAGHVASTFSLTDVLTVATNPC
jgi:superfamily II DNA or RNA helicase